MALVDSVKCQSDMRNNLIQQIKPSQTHSTTLTYGLLSKVGNKEPFSSSTLNYTKVCSSKGIFLEITHMDLQYSTFSMKWPILRNSSNVKSNVSFHENF